MGKYSNPFTATLAGIVNIFKRNDPVGDLHANDRIDGKTCLVTGANSGLGFAVACQLAERGGEVIMACRSGIPEAGERARKLTGLDRFKMMNIDLTNRGSIHSFIERLKSDGTTIDILVFNAAMVPGGSRKNADGLDEMFMVNYLSKFILVNALIENKLINTSEETLPRIIYVSSESHRSGEDLNFNDFGKYEEYTMGKVIALYGYYKLHLNTLASELSRKLNKEGVRYSVHSLCPGAVNSNIAKEAPKFTQPLLKVVFGIFFQAPKKAAWPVIYLACSKSIEGQTGLYLHMKARKNPDPRALDRNNGELLWKKSQELLDSLTSESLQQ